MARPPATPNKRTADASARSSPPRRGEAAAAPPRESGRRYRAPARLIGGQFQIESWTPIIILTGLSLLLCVVVFPPLGWWPLAYVCLTPWAVCVCTTERARRVYLSSYLFGLGYLLINVRWMAGVTLPGYLAMCIFLALSFPLAAWPVRHMFRRHGASLAIALPIVWTAVEYLRSQSLVGFPWYLLAHTHYRVLPMIQISDLVGAYGVSFVVAMVNGWVTDLLIQPILIWRRDQPERTTRLPIGSMATLSVVTATLLYGAMTTPATTAAPTTAAAGSGGPRVAVIQHDFPSFVDSAHARRTPPGVVFESYMELVRQAAAQQPDLIVLPETPWPGYFNDEFLGADAATLEQIRKNAYPDYSTGEIEGLRNWSRETREALRAVGRECGAAIVTGGFSIEWKPLDLPPRVERFNSAYLFRPSPEAPVQRYDKIHLVIFGEFVPFRYSRLHWFYRWLNSITPWGAGGVEYSLSFGEAFRTLEFAARSLDGRRLRAGTPICYEDTQPYVARAFAESPDRAASPKGVDVLLNISNDGWFWHSSELEMHLAASVFRAVENRVPLARAVNTGASAVIDPSGRVQLRVQAGPDKLAHLPAARDALLALKSVLAGQTSGGTADAARAQARIAALERLHSALAAVGREFVFMADRLRGLVADASGPAADAADRAAVIEQINEDLRTIDRWQAKPGTAPAVGIAELRLDPRETLYTRWGDWFTTACGLLTAAMLLDWLLCRIRGRPVVIMGHAAAAMLAIGVTLGIGGCGSPHGAEPSLAEQRDMEQRSLQFLLTATSSETPLYRMHAVEALQGTAPSEGRQRIRAAARDETPPVRFAALLALATLRDRESAELFRQSAEDNDRSVRAAAIAGLHRIGDARRTSELANLLLKDPEPKVRANAALAIGVLGEQKSVKLLQRALGDREELVRLQALDSMVLLGDPRATRDLIFYGHSGAGPKMVSALMTLGTARAKSAEELFVYRLREGPYDEVRLAAARGLGRLGRDDGYDLAFRLLAFNAPDPKAKDDPPAQQELRMRTLAAAALEAIGDRAALDALAGVMEDDMQQMPVRIAAARAILGIRRRGELAAQAAGPGR